MYKFSLGIEMIGGILTFCFRQFTSTKIFLIFTQKVVLITPTSSRDFFLLHERESAPPSISKPALVLLLLLILCVQLFLGYRADRRDPNILFSPT